MTKEFSWSVRRERDLQENVDIPIIIEDFNEENQNEGLEDIIKRSRRNLFPWDN